MDTGDKWRALTDSDLLWRSWDDEYVVYHTGSGDTHALTPLAADVLRALQQDLATREELTRRIAASFDISCDAELAAHIEEILAHLKRADLVERVRS